MPFLFYSRIGGGYRQKDNIMKTSFWGFTVRIFSIILLFLFVYSGNICAQKVLSKSESMRPAWLANRLPRPTNATFHYQLTEAEGKTLDEARQACLQQLSDYVAHSWKISGKSSSDIQAEETDGLYKENSSFTFHYEVDGGTVDVLATKYDEYWEQVYYPGGSRYRCYALFGVADVAAPDFDRLTFTRKYGARGLVRSMFIPGWGQMYKGSTVKGVCILGGEALLAGGIIVAENLRSSYVKKMHEQPKHQQTYNTKADNWENVRNGFIGAAAALYVYNIVDALVANGRKRAVTDKRVRFSMAPALGDCNGVSLALNF
jgi:hypothetical protein